MVILFVLTGIAFGSAAAGATFWVGGSILLAVLAYGVFGTVAVLGMIAAAYMRFEKASGDDWPGMNATAPAAA